jgi:hypothetical protein
MLFMGYLLLISEVPCPNEPEKRLCTSDSRDQIVRGTPAVTAISDSARPT